MNFSDDRAAVRYLGLGDLHLQTILSKSRQAIHAGLTAYPVYFRRSELELIYTHVMMHMREKAHAFEAYIRASRTSEDAEAILSVHGFFQNPEIPLGVKEVVIVVPDFRYLSHENSTAADYVLSLTQFGLNAVTFVVADDHEQEALQRAVDAVGAKLSTVVSVVTIGDVSALPYMLFFVRNGTRDIDGYVLSDIVFRHISGYRSSQIFQRVTQWLVDKKQRTVARARRRAG
jgi:hypothetical protein